MSTQQSGNSALLPAPTCRTTQMWGACHYLTNRFQMEAPVAPSRSLREAFKRAPRSLRGACLREGFAEPPRRLLEPFAADYEPFAEVAHTEDSTKTPWRVHGASSKGPWMNCMFLHDHDSNRVWLYYTVDSSFLFVVVQTVVLTVMCIIVV